MNTPLKQSPVVFCPAPGDTVCNAEDYSAEYVAPFDFGHVVRPIFEVRDDDGSPRDIVSTVPVIWTEVFPGDACPKMAAGIEEQRNILAALRKQVQEARQDMSSTQSARAEIMARLKEHDVLRRLDGMLAGQATHYVTCGSDSNYEIHAISEEKPDMDFRHEGELRLLSLTARRSRNELTWELNRYRDGSGTSKTVVPCFSLEEAKEVLGERCAEKWVAWLSGNSVSYISYVADACRKWNLPIPQKYLDEEQARQLASTKAEVDRLTKAAEAANAALLKLQGDASHAQ